MGSKNKREAIGIRMASPEKVLSWSYGEVTKAVTVNYKTQRAELDGLFCQKIFGPIKDYSCICTQGSKKNRYANRGSTCEKCGVDIVKSEVRRHRMGHISLKARMINPIFALNRPSPLSTLLGIKYADMKRIMNCELYLVTSSQDREELPICTPLDFSEYQELLRKVPFNFIAKTGGDAIHDLLKKIRLDNVMAKLMDSDELSAQGRERMNIINNLADSDNELEWMTLTVLPVLPPELRPMVPQQDGRFATSDLNKLYLKVLKSNERLEKLQLIQCPDVVVNNERRILQQSINALFLGGRTRDSLRSLTDNLKGKSGRFRQNVLGKRVDYSGRSVIVVGPELKLHQCGVPKKMALELFRPFVHSKLLQYGIAATSKYAKKMVDRYHDYPKVWECLDEVIQNRVIILNRQPTLHRFGMQAFEPVLIESLAIQLHPLVCVAYNADFDGDQMTVHVPITDEAQSEARKLMISSRNFLSTASGDPIVSPNQDMVLGIYYMTYLGDGGNGAGMVFADASEAVRAYSSGCLDIHSPIKARVNGVLYDTTVGRLILSESIPDGIGFESINRNMDNNCITELLDECYRLKGPVETSEFADKLVHVGFKYSSVSGCSLNIADLEVPDSKHEAVRKASNKIAELIQYEKDSLLSSDERYFQSVNLWMDVSNSIGDDLIESLDPTNPIMIYANSGARGSPSQIRQMAGIRGLMTKTDGSVIDTPITSSFREGLTVDEYAISTYGARKGAADTALKTSGAGYLTRRLVDAAHDVIVREEDCGTSNGIPLNAGDSDIADRLVGRVLVGEDHPLIYMDVTSRLETETKFNVRSPVTCETVNGICSKCYGWDLSKSELAEVGDAVGVVAAQSIGEPGTQLTLRTFHTGGAASGASDNPNITSSSIGTVLFHSLDPVMQSRGKLVATSRSGELEIVDSNGNMLEKYSVPYGAQLNCEGSVEVNPGDVLAEWNPDRRPILSGIPGSVEFIDIIQDVTASMVSDPLTGLEQVKILGTVGDRIPRLRVIQNSGEGTDYIIPEGSELSVSAGDIVSAGDELATVSRGDTGIRLASDITGGLPRVEQLFEVRESKTKAVMAPASGYVELFKDGRKNYIAVVDESGERHVTQYQSNVNLHVIDGDTVYKGEVISTGVPSLRDMLSIQGLDVLVSYMVDEVQSVYKKQGIKISDKHIEVILRKVLNTVEIIDPGMTNLREGSVVYYSEVMAENRKLRESDPDLRGAQFKRLLTSITQSSLKGESFISAASFQRTVEVLRNSAIQSKVDKLTGIKENVVVGRLIPTLGKDAPVFEEEEEVVRVAEGNGKPAGKNEDELMAELGHMLRLQEERTESSQSEARQ